MIRERFDQALPIIPSFPNWNKSFVSGLESPLFVAEHRVALEPLELISKVTFKDAAEGPPGHVHGGASAALIDEVMGILVWNQNMPCVTKELKVKFLKPLPMHAEVFLITKITGTEKKTVEVHTIIYTHEKTPCVEGNGVFHRMSKELFEKFLTHSPKRK